MPVFLSTDDADFETLFQSLVVAKSISDATADDAVKTIVEDVRQRGDEAVLHYTARFDRVRCAHLADLRLTSEEIDTAVSAVSSKTYAALELAHDRIADFHRRQKPQDMRYKDAIGVELGWRWTPLDAAGIYVPGGTASYPSSVLMNAVPAKVAGVERVVMTVPSPDGALDPLVLVAARLAGIDEIYRIGGAQAVAALAYGTETLAPVDKITGPGNAFVAAAKRRVFGVVGIDMIAGPSEVVIVADAKNDPDWLAADLLAQAEHDTGAQAVLIATDRDFAHAVAEAVERQLRVLPREAIARESWDTFGALIVVSNLGKAADLVNRLAPEHLELAVNDPEALFDNIRHAGAVFLGRYTPEAIGDYVGGPNHVLPTARSARFSSGLSVLDFLKRTSILRCAHTNLGTLAGPAMRLAKAEGLAGHSRSIGIRANIPGEP